MNPKSHQSHAAILELLGDDFIFDDVAEVYTDTEFGDDEAKYLKELTNLRLCCPSTTRSSPTPDLSISEVLLNLQDLLLDDDASYRLRAHASPGAH